MVFGFLFSRKLGLSAKIGLSRKVWFPATYFQHKVIRQSSVQISLITQKFSASFFNNIKRKYRSEAFCVSSENILHLTFRGLKMWRKPTPSLYKYNQNFKLNNCAISKIPETSHIFKPLLNAVLYFRNLKDNATFYRKVWFSAFHCHANLICRAKFGFPQRIFNTKLFGKVRFRFHLSRKSFRQVFLKLSNRKIGAKRSA